MFTSDTPSDYESVRGLLIFETFYWNKNINEVTKYEIGILSGKDMFGNILLKEEERRHFSF